MAILGKAISQEVRTFRKITRVEEANGFATAWKTLVRYSTN